MYKIYLEVKNMLKKNLVWLAVVLIAGTALLGAVCFAAEKAPAEMVKVQGVVGVTKDASGVITAVTLTAADGVVYNVTLDDNGKKLGEEMADKKVEVEGTISEKDDAKWITVQSYAAEAAPPA
jgi:flagellar basal body-associated protein FliL